MKNVLFALALLCCSELKASAVLLLLMDDGPDPCKEEISLSEYKTIANLVALNKNEKIIKNAVKQSFTDSKIDKCEAKKIKQISFTVSDRYSEVIKKLELNKDNKALKKLVFDAMQDNYISDKEFNNIIRK